MTITQITGDELKAILKALHSVEFQLLIGAEEWNLTEEEENHIWDVIKRTGDEQGSNRTRSSGGD